MMFRSVANFSRQAYTCLCVPKFLQSHHACGLVSLQTRKIHTTSIVRVLDKDVRDKKSSASLKTIREDPASEDMELKLEGMMTSGIPFPTRETHSVVIDGTRYDELPIVHIYATRNNTIITLVDHKGKAITSSSGGAEGFRNARKGTNIAGQAVGLSIGQRAVSRGFKYIRVSAKEFGPGRLSAIKGLQMGGAIVVSITDATKLPFNTGRPRKQRRL